jgi:hypothetical protein
MLPTMSLRDFFRRHRNVFSISTREVDGGRGNEDMLVEEYGERATETEHEAGWVGRGGGGAGSVSTAGSALGLASVQPDPSYDEIADGEPPPDQAS